MPNPSSQHSSSPFVATVRPHERGVFHDLDAPQVLLVYTRHGKRIARVELAEGVDVDGVIARLWIFLELEDPTPLKLIG